MENQIKNLEIQNFKSIKHLQLECKRVNILIGEPNVGKSNILEALSLLGAGYEKNYNKFLSSFVRYENFNSLFYDKDLTKDIQIITDEFFGLIHYHFNNINTYSFFINGKKAINPEIQKLITTRSLYPQDIDNEIQKLNLNKDIPIIYRKILQNGSSNESLLKLLTPIKKYDFKVLEKYDNTDISFLNPPFGDNIFAVLDNNNEIQEEASSFFAKYGLKLRFNTEQNKLEIQKEIGNRVYIYSYSNIADTLQRIIFYLTAIESNKDSVLLFEEPEAHSFPPYVGMLADRIAQDEDNQYFIATHSPLLLDSIIEGTSKEDRNIIITYFRDYETKIKVLKEEEIKEFMNNRIDLFYNINRFIDEYVSPFAD